MNNGKWIWIKKYLPTLVSIFLILILLIYTPWHDTLDELSEVQPTSILILLLLSLVYYAAKSIRYWYMLRPIGINVPIGTVLLTYLGAQPVSLLPAGELYRNTMLERYTGTPMAKSAPTFLMQGLLEGIVLIGLALISGLALGRAVPGLVLTAILIAIAVVILRGGYLSRSRWVVKLINQIPYVELSRRSLITFGRQNKALLSLKPFASLLALSIVAEVAGVAIVYLSVHALGGQIDVYTASIVYVIPIIISFISFLPGGLGANEQSTVGLMRLFHIASPVAFGATLLVRVFITGVGLIYGWVAEAVLKLSYPDSFK